MAEPVVKKKRFATLNEEEFKQIIENKDSKNTKRATDSSVRIFKSYLKEKDLPENFEELSNLDIDRILSKFYAEVRTESGDRYKKSSLFAIRHGINRYLTNISSDKDIINNKDFSDSNKVFSAAVKELKREGKGAVDHYPPLELSDMQKLYSYLDTDNNIKLQQKVFVDLMLYFGRRGRENIHDLKITDFAATRDSKGKLYIFMKTDELTKNHQVDANTAEGRMYARDDELCPVKSFTKYTRHLHGNKCNRLFQRPNTHKGSLKWYNNVPLGHNTIGNFMPELSEAAKLSRRYTNHSLRATSVHILDNIGNFAGRHIMSVTGHKSEASLKTYTGYTGEQIKKNMSDTISNSLRKSNKATIGQHPMVDNFTESSMPVNDFVLEPLSNAQFKDILSEISDDDFDDILLHIGEKENLPQQIQQNVSQNCIQNVPVPVPVFNYCSNITINYNFEK